MKIVEIRQIQDLSEVIILSPLIHKFFERLKPNYTEQQLYEHIPEILKTGVIFYVIEDGTPRSYVIGEVKSTWQEDVVFLLQVYSEKPYYVKRLKESGDNWCREHGYKKQVALIDPEKENYFSMHFQMKKDFIYMSREVKEVETKNIDLEKVDLAKQKLEEVIL